jgi:predicted permease
MSRLAEISRRLRAFLFRARVERELDEEMRLHVALRQERLRAAGLPAHDAERAAMRHFGNRRRLQEEGMDVWGWRWLEHLAQDVRFGARTLARNRVFAAAAILTLGLATGVTTAIFSVVNSVLLRPLPFDHPDRLVQIYGRNWREDRGGTPDAVTGPVSSQELDEAARQATLFEGFAGYARYTRHLEGPSGVERVGAVVADLSFFSVLGVAPVVGRTFHPGDPASVAVISERLWRERFNGSPTITGTALTLDNRVVTIVGVMPVTFEFPYPTGSPVDRGPAEARTDVWMPFEPADASAAPQRRGRTSVIARLKPGVGLPQAAAELSVIAARIEQQYYSGTRVRVAFRARPLADEVLGRVRTSLWMLFAAVGLVLITACANVANLLLARMTLRAREVVTRAALGAGRLRLARQFLAESLLLSLLGGAVGAAIAWFGAQALIAVYTGRLPRVHEVALDWRAFAFLLTACVAAAAMFGLAPAFTASRMDAHELTKESGGHATSGRKFRYLRDALVAVEIALAFVLAVGAALVIREIVRLQNTPSGMTTENVVVLHVSPRTAPHDYYAIEERVAQLPGVRGAGFIQFMPLQNWGWQADFEIRGRPAEAGQRRTTDLRFVTPGYFGALGIPVVKGRGFTAADSADAPRVILINEALARRYFGAEEPVGRELDRGTIIGVVGDVRSAELSRAAEPELYYAVAQNVAVTSEVGMSLVVRTDGAPERAIASIRSAIVTVNPKLAVFNIRTMEQLLDDSLWQLNLYRWLIGLFAALTLILAAIGLYGMISYTASARAREFAIRLALGSGKRALAQLVLGRGLQLAAAGLVVGVVAVMALTWWFADLPATIRPDVVICAAVSAVVILIALVACAAPSMRAASIDPAVALRQG